MFDSNKFKRAVKEWMAEHPEGTENELIDFCEELIPPQQFAVHQWLIDQTVSWYRHVLVSRETHKNYTLQEDM